MVNSAEATKLMGAAKSFLAIRPVVQRSVS